MYYKNKIHKTTKVMASLRILNIILNRFQSCFIHILANGPRANFEVKNKSFRALSHIFFQKLNMSGNTSTFIKLPFVFKTFVLSILEWPLKTGLTVL